MKNSIQEQLAKKHPDFFSCLPYGIRCGDGWANLVESIAETVTSTGRKAIDIYEDQGGLRVRLTGDLELGAHISNLVFHLSKHVCENCGIIDNTVTTVKFADAYFTRCSNCIDAVVPAQEKSYDVKVVSNVLKRPQYELKSYVIRNELRGSREAANGSLCITKKSILDFIVKKLEAPESPATPTVKAEAKTTTE